MAVPIPPNPSIYESLYDPALVLNSPEWRKLAPDAPELKDEKANLACGYNPAHEVNMWNKPIPKARPGECIVHVKATGICGSDVHFWKHGRIGDLIVNSETGAGHESAGEIIEVGEGVTQFQVGDKVAIEAGLACGQVDCMPCHTGRYNACARVVFFSTPPYHGTMTRFHAHPAAWLHKLPDNVSFEEGSLCEPLAVALAGLERAGTKLGDPVLICGAGPIGLVTLLAARASGCAPIVLTDIVQSRLDFAKKLVPAVRTVCVPRNATPESVGGMVREAAGMHLKECSGFESSIRTAIHSVVFGGKVFITGVGPHEQGWPFGYCSINEIDVQLQYRYAHQYPKAIRLVSEGLINLKPLVTHRFPLNKAVEAFQTAADPTTGAIKVQIQD